MIQSCQGPIVEKKTRLISGGPFQGAVFQMILAQFSSIYPRDVWPKLKLRKCKLFPQ